MTDKPRTSPFRAIKAIDYTVIFARDMAAMRRFYEDILGMPMVSALKENHGAGTDREDPFVHCFFEMADGSCLAFFQFLPDAFNEALNLGRHFGPDYNLEESTAPKIVALIAFAVLAVILFRVGLMKTPAADQGSQSAQAEGGVDPSP